MKLVLILFSALLLAGCSNPTSTPGYRYHGLKAAVKSEVFQDFQGQSSCIQKSWADPASLTHDGQDPSWLKAQVINGDTTYLKVDYNRQGWGCNFTLQPNNLEPLILDGPTRLSFELRAERPVALGLRVMEGDAEVWGYGTETLDYELFTHPGGGQWKTMEVNLAPDPAKWFHFPHAGNRNSGNGKPDFSVLALVEFELGFPNAPHLGSGEGTIHLRKVSLKRP